MGNFISRLLFLHSQSHLFSRRFDLSQTIIGIKRNWLDFILISKFIKGETVSADTCIYLRTKVSIVIDNFPSNWDFIFSLAGLEKFSQYFDFFPLYFGYQSIFLLGFPDFYLFYPLHILLSNVFLPFDDPLLHEFKSFVV